MAVGLAVAALGHLASVAAAAPGAAAGTIPAGGAIATSKAAPAIIDLAWAATPSPDSDLAKIAALADTTGLRSLMLGLRIDFSGVGRLDATALAAQRARIKTEADRVDAVLRPYGIAPVTRWNDIGQVAGKVSGKGIRALAASGVLSHIWDNTDVRPELMDYNSNTVIQAHGPGQQVDLTAGAGQTIAIIDSGIQATHPWMLDAAGNTRVTRSACFAENWARNVGYFRPCPNGTGVQRANDSSAGVPCPATDCDHGTFVAGVAAGRDPEIVNSGVAPAANIWSVRTGNYDCILIIFCHAAVTVNDWINGLAWVTETSANTGTRVSAVNFSLGIIGYNSNCPDSQFRPAVINLTTMGTAVVVAAGNAPAPGATRPGVAEPACLPEAISVGATIGSGGPAPRSQYGRVNLLAPGVDIKSSVPGIGNTTSAKSGTSFAAPQVTGAIARLRARRGWSESAARMLEILRTNGDRIPDPRDVIWVGTIPFPATIPRINVARALTAP